MLRVFVASVAMVAIAIVLLLHATDEPEDID
jgi:hypothetical protein